jgi:hypothetical protein
MGVASAATAPPSVALDADQIADTLRTSIWKVLQEKAAEAAKVPVKGLFVTWGFPVCVDGRMDAALTCESMVMPVNADLEGGKLTDDGYALVRWLPGNGVVARCVANHAICELPDDQGRSDHKKAKPICFNYLDFFKTTSSKTTRSISVQQEKGATNRYRVISEAEANLFRRVGVAKQGALTHFITWEVSKYSVYGLEDGMAEGNGDAHLRAASELGRAAREAQLGYVQRGEVRLLERRAQGSRFELDRAAQGESTKRAGCQRAPIETTCSGWG